METMPDHTPKIGHQSREALNHLKRLIIAIFYCSVGVPLAVMDENPTSGKPFKHTYHVRMILLGEAGTGKSCLFHRIKYKTFRDVSDPQSGDNHQSSVHTRQLYDSYTTNIRISSDTRVSVSTH